jgi:hypothetical protein
MGRIDQRLVGKRQEPVVQRVVEACAEVVGCPPERSPQVGAADVSDKQRVSREDGARFCRVLLEIEDQDRNGLDRMAGSFEDFEAQSRELQRIPVLHRHESVFRLGAGTEMDRRAPTVA